MRFTTGQHIHCIGIGGFGISAIARILLERGFSVSGSDRAPNALTDALSRDGATIYVGHSADYVQNADIVIATSAVGSDHVEVAAAHARKIPVYKRQDILAPLTEGHTVIAVAGTHGKTTTTSMIVHILQECGLDPSYIVGGVMAKTGTNAGVGKDLLFVIEADEYDNMFLGLKPDIAVITNIEYDHPDFFPTLDDVLYAFDEFADSLSRYGVLVGCGDDIYVEALLDKLVMKNWQKPGDEWLLRGAVTYGVDNVDSVNVLCTGVHVEDNCTVAAVDLVAVRGLRGMVATLRLPLIGKHNVQNALAALAVANLQYIPFPDAAKALESFQSTARRFSVRGEVDGVIVIDDYAHHPTAIRVTLEAARMRYPNHDIWAVWQPHMYTRTQCMMSDFAVAFSAADHVIVTDIYPAREAPIPGVDGAWVAGEIRHKDVYHASVLDDVVTLLREKVTAPHAAIVVMSAGDAIRVGEDYLATRPDRE